MKNLNILTENIYVALYNFRDALWELKPEPELTFAMHCGNCDKPTTATRLDWCGSDCLERLVPRMTCNVLSET